MAPTSPLPKTHILGSDYVSMSRCAHDYRQILEGLGCYEPSLEAADVVMVHASFGQVADMLRGMPGLAAKYLVGYLVWEADRLPPAAVPLTQYFDEVWTPTWFSAKSLLPAAQFIRWLPHVVRPQLTPSQQTQADLEALLGAPGRCAMLQIGRGTDARKNFEETAQAFEAACIGRPGLTLVQKHAESSNPDKSAAPTCRRIGNVLHVHGSLSNQAIAGLYARSHFVLSPHHGEGWGLTLSEGMAAGVPGIASNYSGNLAFMTARNSILIDGYEAPVRDADKNQNFSAPMRWHYSFPGHIEAAVARAYEMVGTAAYDAMATQAKRIRRVYDMRHIRVLLRSYLKDIERRGALRPDKPYKLPYRQLD